MGIYWWVIAPYWQHSIKTGITWGTQNFSVIYKDSLADGTPIPYYSNNTTPILLPQKTSILYPRLMGMEVPSLGFHGNSIDQCVGSFR